MPLYSDHISNMYYSGSPSYSTPYTGYSSVLPLSSSYGASYLGPGGNYSSHSSLGGYSRPAPLSSRWVPSSGRNYSPMLSTISERGNSSPVRLNSPRRIHYSTKRSYAAPPSYTPRPININTADIDVSKDKYRHKHEDHTPPPEPPPEIDNGPFMPRVDGKPETGIDSSPGIQRSTLRRGRTVVRLHTIKRKDRDSPRKPQSELPQENQDEPIMQDASNDLVPWREKLSEDLTYKDKREKKTLGAKLVEKFIVRDKDSDSEGSFKEKRQKQELSQSLSEPGVSEPSVPPYNRSPDRRCSMELLAEQAKLLDTLIRGENLSTATLDLSKLGIQEEQPPPTIEHQPSNKKRKSSSKGSPLQTTKSDHSLNESFQFKDAKSFSKRRSLKKSQSGGSICRLDSIKELPREPIVTELPVIEEIGAPLKRESVKIKPQPKMKAVITSSVEVIAPISPLKFKVDVTVEETLLTPKTPNKEIFFNTVVEDPIIIEDRPQQDKRVLKRYSKARTKPIDPIENPSPEPDDGNFWDKIGKRETVYLMKRKQMIDETVARNRRALFWFPEDDELNEGIENDQINDFDNLMAAENSSFEGDAVVKDTCQLVQHNKVENTDKDISKLQTNTCEQFSPLSEKKKEIVEESGSKAVIDPLTLKVEKAKENKNSSEINNKVTSVGGQASEELKSETIRVPEETILQEKTKEIQPKDVAMNISLIKTEDKIQPTEENEPKSESDVSVPENKSSEIHCVKKEKTESLGNTTIAPEKSSDISADQNETCPSCGGMRETKDDKMDELSTTTTTVDEKDKKVEESNSISQKSTPEVSKKEEVEKKPTPTKSPVVKAQSEKQIDSKKAAAKLSPEKVKKSDKVQNKTANIQPEKKATGAIPKVPLNKNKAEEKPIKPKEEVKSTKIKPQSKPIQKDSAITQSKVPKVKESNVEITSSQNDSPPVPAASVVIETENIPKTDIETKVESNKLEPVQEEKVAGASKPECLPITVEKVEVPPAAPLQVVKPPSPRRPVKEEPALRPLIATPRPLQKRTPQVIHSSSSSESSSEEESSDEDADESDTSEESNEFYECETLPDGRTSTGSNDSGFDSSAPTSPAGFLHIKKDCDVNCHWKCEKLTANLCGVNQRLLVEALAARASSKKGGEPTPAGTSADKDTSDLVEHELEQSTAYGLFRKTGRFTPPARSIPRFRKYNIEDFHFIKVLGKGSFGKVLLAELRDTEYYYAVKCLKKDVVLEDDDVECTLIERKVLALGTNHPYLCHLFATFQTDSHLFFVMEYLNGGDLMFHIQQSGRFPEARARFYAAEIVSGLKFLHKRGIVYRDLKLDNILLDFDGHVRIADFGMCKLQIYLDKTADTFCGTPDYMAPEIIKGLKYNQTVDWWSFGVLLYEMLIGQSPFSGCDEDELFWSICNEMPSYPRFLSQESLTILTRLLDKDARTRMGGTDCMHGDIRDQDFFRPISWDKLERRELEAPFRPRVRHPLDTQYFDRAFTGERPRLTAVEPHVLRTMDQEAFRGFSYTNPNATDR